MLSHYVQLHDSKRALLHVYLVGSIFCLSLRLHALPYVRSDTTVDPMYVRAANALMRLCIFAQALLSYRCWHINIQVCLISWHVFQIYFLRLRARRRSDSCL